MLSSGAFAILDCTSPFDSCLPFASTRTFSIFGTGILSRATLDSLLVVRLEGAVSSTYAYFRDRFLSVSPSALQ